MRAWRQSVCGGGFAGVGAIAAARKLDGGGGVGADTAEGGSGQSRPRGSSSRPPWPVAGRPEAAAAGGVGGALFLGFRCRRRGGAVGGRLGRLTVVELETSSGGRFRHCRSGVSAYGRSGCAKRAGGGASFFSLPVSTLSLLELLPFFVGSFGWVEAAAGQWRKLKRPKRCCLVPGSPLAEHGERPAGGGTEVAWASSQGRSGGMQRAGGRVLQQVRKSAGGGAPVRSWWKPRAANACVVVNELMGDKLLERLQGFQA